MPPCQLIFQKFSTQDIKVIKLNLEVGSHPMQRSYIGVQVKQYKKSAPIPCVVWLSVISSC